MLVCVLKKQVRFGERAGTTVVDGVGQGHCLQRVNHRQAEDRLHGGLVEAGERLPGVGWLHLCGGKDSVQNTSQSERPEVRGTILVVVRILSKTQNTEHSQRHQRSEIPVCVVPLRP